MTLLIEMIIQNPVLWIICIISMFVHSTSQCLTSFTNIQKSTECTFYTVNDIYSRTVQRVKRFGVVSFSS
jgi:sugar phosphate permease